MPEWAQDRIDALEASVRELREDRNRLWEALSDVPYAITMALQWTLVPSDVPEVMHEPLRVHREMLAQVHDSARAALNQSSVTTDRRF